VQYDISVAIMEHTRTDVHERAHASSVSVQHQHQHYSGTDGTAQQAALSPTRVCLPGAVQNGGSLKDASARFMVAWLQFKKQQAAAAAAAAAAEAFRAMAAVAAMQA